MLKIIYCDVDHDKKYNSNAEKLFQHYRKKAGFREYCVDGQMDLSLIEGIFNSLRLSRNDSSFKNRERLVSYCIDSYFPFAKKEKSPKGYNPQLKKDPNSSLLIDFVDEPPLTMSEVRKYIYKNASLSSPCHWWFSFEGLIALRLRCLVEASNAGERNIKLASYSEFPKRVSVIDLHNRRHLTRKHAREEEGSPSPDAPQEPLLKRRAIPEEMLLQVPPAPRRLPYGQALRFISNVASNAESHSAEALGEERLDTSEKTTTVSNDVACLSK